MRASYKKMFFFVFCQTHIINYYKSINSFKLLKSFKFDVIISNFNLTSIKFVSINQIAKISHYNIFASKHRFSHICRFCHETFTFNNDLHHHLRLIHLIFKSNQLFENSILHDRKKSQIKSFVFDEHIIHICFNNSILSTSRHHFSNQ